MLNPKLELTELHCHIGAGTEPLFLWTSAHDQGLKLPTKDFWQFKKLITIPLGKQMKNLDEYLSFFYWTELIQSSPLALADSIYDIICGAYIKNNITTLELRFNPMKRNRGGEKDLDHIILAACHAVDKARLAFPKVRCGLILMMDRTFSLEMNKIIVEKAIKYKKYNIIGIDNGGPSNAKFKYCDLKPLVSKAKKAGLGVTIHTGEEGKIKDMEEVINDLKPSRIGHGILAAYHPKIMKQLVKNNIVLEICPSSSLHSNAVKNAKELKFILRTFLKNKVKFTINTDGAKLNNTNLRKEMNFLLKGKILTEKDILHCNQIAQKASFLP